ncbi:hypothetical protein B0H19DRAFT_1010315 [Mycena capillaripes]|nr:hypothetical protein B0H19DRAFT_1010315 [Mycena capillaripes]
MVLDQTNPLQAFLDFLRGPNGDLFAWDDVDNAILYRALVTYSELGLFPRDWNQYMVEIDFATWRQIIAMTRTVDRPRRQPENLWIRLAAVSVEFSATLTIPRNILAPFNLSPDQFPLGFIADVVHKNYKTQCALVIFESKAFWAASNLRLWLSACCQDLCRAIWLSSHLTVLERVQFMYAVCDRTVLPKNLAVYTYSLLPQYSNQEQDIGLSEFTRSFGACRFLDSLTHYRFDVETLFTFLKHYRWTTQKNSTTSHTIATNVYELMKLDISALVARLVLFLQSPRSYKEFLTYRGMEAQELLDFLQDCLDLDLFLVVKPLICKALLRLCRASGRHPHCLVLTGLRKVGQQVAAGGFGDIWKGLIGGRSVCVKIMRLFRDADIQAVVKVYFS